MALSLKRPLVFFDLETTGREPQTDRIVELAAVTLQPDGSQSVVEWRLNPTIPIPAAASAVHGIFDADVADKPTFAQMMPTFLTLFTGVDLGGYNARSFDIPFLDCEFARCGITQMPYANAAVVDAKEIFFAKEPRTLAAALKFYCGEALTDAHSAKADVLATASVLKAQLQRYDDLPSDPRALHEMFAPKEKWIDPTRKLLLDDAGAVVINFGQHRGQRLSDLATNKRDYLLWILQGEWHPKVLEAVKNALA